MDIQKERKAFNKEFGINNADTFPAFSGGIESSAVLKCNWLGWKKRAELECKENPETIEIEGLKTIHKLCKFGAEHDMEGCSFTEIVDRMFDELTKAQAVPEWISVKDQLPPSDPYNREYWVYETLNNKVQHDYWVCPDTGLDQDFEPFFNNWPREVTHWMPMVKYPKPPVQAQEQSNV